MSDLEELRKIPAARQRLDAEELALIDRARRSGATWAQIAEALGLASRQAAEQRRLRLATTVQPVRAELDEGYGARLTELRAAAVALHRRIGADRRWDRRFGRAALVRETLQAAPNAVGGAMFSLVNDVIGDLSEGIGPLPGPTRAAVQRLRRAWEAASEQH